MLPQNSWCLQCSFSHFRKRALASIWHLFLSLSHAFGMIMHFRAHHNRIALTILLSLLYGQRIDNGVSPAWLALPVTTYIHTCMKFPCCSARLSQNLDTVPLLNFFVVVFFVRFLLLSLHLIIIFMLFSPPLYLSHFASLVTLLALDTWHSLSARLFAARRWLRCGDLKRRVTAKCTYLSTT